MCDYYFHPYTRSFYVFFNRDNLYCRELLILCLSYKSVTSASLFGFEGNIIMNYRLTRLKIYYWNVSFENPEVEDTTPDGYRNAMVI